MTAPTKTPIEPSEIRAGDTIERHWMGTVMTMPVARLSAKGGLAYSPEGYCMGLLTGDGEKFYLLDRPTPPVTLPTEPTLGWARVFDPSAGGARGTELGIWVGADDRGRTVRFTEDRGDRVLQRTREFDAAHITAFTPATAVPTDALDRMRRVAATCDATYPDYKEAVFAFLAAVDEATS